MEGLAAGAFSAWLAATRAAQKNRRLGADVPCGSCNSCCRAAFFIHIRPEEAKALARIPKALLFPAPGLPKGHVLMGYNDHNSCPMLVNDKCSIYADRPQACRDFDCRLFAATGVKLEDEARREVEERARQWQFSYPQAVDRQEAAAVKAAADFLRDHQADFDAGAVPVNPSQQALLAVKVYDVFSQVLARPAAERPSDAAIARAVMAAWEEFEPAPPRA